MNAVKTLTLRTYRHFMHDTMRRSSIFLMASRVVSSAGIFLFFVICAHLFKATTVGLATSFISYGILAASFTTLGLPDAIIRFFATSKDKGGLLSASIYLLTGASLAGSLVAILLIGSLVPKLGFVQESPFLMVTLALLIFFTGLSALLDAALIALRNSEAVLIKTIIVCLPRLILPFVVVNFGIHGMTGAYVSVYILGIVYNLIIVLKRLLIWRILLPSFPEVKRRHQYALSNYLGGIFGILPITVLPIIILSKLGPAAAAYFYMPLQIATFLSVISASVSQALLSEAADTNELETHKRYFLKAFRHQNQILILLIVLLSIAAWPILRIFGSDYASHGLVPLLILLASSLLVGLNWMGDTWLNVRGRPKAFFFMNASNGVLVTGFAYAFAGNGLVGVSVGWLTGQLVSVILYALLFTKDVAVLSRKS